VWTVRLVRSHGRKRLVSSAESGCEECLQLIEQRLGFLQVARVKAFGKPLIDRRQGVRRWRALAAEFESLTP
jgi:hypothetical protein